MTVNGFTDPHRRPLVGSAACPIMAATAWGESVKTTTSATSRKSSEMVGNRRDPSGTTSPPPYVVGGGKSSPSPPGVDGCGKENGWPPGAGSAQGHVRAKPALGGEWGENKGAFPEGKPTAGKCQRACECFTLPLATTTGGQRRLFSHLSHQRNGPGVGLGASRDEPAGIMTDVRNHASG